MIPLPVNPFTRFVNKTEMVSLGSLARTFGWLFVTVFFTITARQMMLSGDKEVAGFGFQLALAVLGGLGYASSVGAFNHNTQRKTSREYIEAKAKGEALATAEHPALPTVKVEAKDQSKVEINAENGITAARQPNEPDIYRDDERGE